ncbi:hypothetical protein Zmor_019434 [Zophobas morio]|uniref:Uncharacterized protein n=1 Tax=Zophobas morio TaxID=2755281 RepID=A0AA38HZM4_9CUCU|nr:hypothetical protein Zmor_019434 [Zophobas morio]
MPLHFLGRLDHKLFLDTLCINYNKKPRLLLQIGVDCRLRNTASFPAKPSTFAAIPALPRSPRLWICHACTVIRWRLDQTHPLRRLALRPRPLGLTTSSERVCRRRTPVQQHRNRKITKALEKSDVLSRAYCDAPNATSFREVVRVNPPSLYIPGRGDGCCALPGNLGS